MHEETFLSSWLREDGKNKEEGIMEEDKDTRKETGKKRRKEGEKQENEMVIVKRRCVNSVSTEIFSQEEISESGGNSWGDLWDDPCGVSDFDSGTGTCVMVVPVVAVVSVAPSSVVTEVCDGFSLDSDWEFVEPQSFSFYKKRSSVWEENQGEMGYKGSPVKAPPNTRRWIMSPAPQQISFSSTDESQWQADLEEQPSIWSIRERRVIAAIENYLDKSEDMKVEIGPLEVLMDHDVSEVFLRYILAHARRRGSRIFEIFSTKEKADHLVASRNRWLEHQGKRVALQERWQSDWQDVNYEGTVAKAPTCPERRMRTPLPQQSSSSTREEESLWSAQERTAIARTEQYVNNSECFQLDIEEV